MTEAPVPISGGSSSPLGLLAEKNFRHVWLAGATVSVLRWLDMLAVAVYVLNVTGSAFAVAMMMFFRMLPMLLFGAIGGAFAETVDRRKFLMFGQCVMAASYAGLFALAATDNLELWHLAIGVFAGGLFWAIELPTRRIMIAEIAGLDRIGSAMGLDLSTNNFMRMLGPIIGGVTFELFGLPGTLAMGVCLYGLAAGFLSTVEYVPSARPGKRDPMLTSLMEGLRYVLGHRLMLAILAITMVLNLFGFSFVSMMPVIAKEIMGLSPAPTGILMSAEGAGAFVGALLIAFFAKAPRFHQIYFFGSTTYLLCVLAISFSTQFAISFPLLLMAGFGMAGFAAMQSTLMIIDSPPEMRNRVMGVMTMCIGVGPFGLLFVGILADELGAPMAIMITSLIGLTAMLIAGITRPEVRSIRATAST